MYLSLTKRATHLKTCSQTFALQMLRRHPKNNTPCYFFTARRFLTARHIITCSLSGAIFCNIEQKVRNLRGSLLSIGV